MILIIWNQCIRITFSDHPSWVHYPIKDIRKTMKDWTRHSATQLEGKRMDNIDKC